MVDFQTYKFKYNAVWLIVIMLFGCFFSSKSSFASNKECISVIYEPIVCVKEEVIFSLKPLGTCTIRDIKWNFGTDASIKTFEGAEPELISFKSNGKKDISIQYFDVEKEEPVIRIISLEVIQPVTKIKVTQPEPCVGQTIELRADGPIAGYYVWKGGNLSDNSNSGELEYKVTDKLTSPNQTYTLEWYVGKSGGDGGCSYRKITETVEEKVVKPIEFTTENSLIVCEGEAVKIEIKNPEDIQYNWNCNENSLIRQGKSIEFTPKETCEIKVTAYDGTCIRSGSINIIVQKVPKIQIYPEWSMICAGSSVQLHILGAIPGETYSWTENVYLQNTYADVVVVKPDNSETYEVTWLSGECKATASANVQVSNITNILENKIINICEGEEVNLQVTSPNDGIVQWFGGDLDKPVSDEVKVSPLQTTNYSVIWQNSVCSDTGMVTVQVNPLPQIKLVSSVNDRVCKEEEVEIIAQLSDTELGNNFIWHQTNEQQQIVNHFNELSFIAQQSHTIVAEWIDDKQLCQSKITASFDLEVIDRPTKLTLTSNVSKLCYGDTVHFQITGAQNEHKYVLLNADDYETISNEELIDNGFSLIPSKTTTYVAWWVDDCRTISNELQIEVNPIPSITIDTGEEICPYQSFKVKVLPDEYEYKWTGGNIADDVWVTGSTLSRVADDNVLTYNLKVTENECKLDTTVKINLIDIDADITTESPFNEVCEGNTIQLEVAGADEYVWEPAALLDNHLSATPIATPIEPDTRFTVTAYKNGCEFTNSVNINFKSGYDCEINLDDLIIPNAITPNGDGKNDYWVIPDIAENPNYSLTIFNAAGTIIYHAKTYDNKFNGINNGKIPEGTYYYVIVQKNGLAKKTGTLTIIRW